MKDSQGETWADVEAAQDAAHAKKTGHRVFAAQELAEYKAMIKELLPIAENVLTIYSQRHNEYEKLKATIERARKLIKL